MFGFKATERSYFCLNLCDHADCFLHLSLSLRRPSHVYPQASTVSSVSLLLFLFLSICFVLSVQLNDNKLFIFPSLWLNILK